MERGYPSLTKCLDHIALCGNERALVSTHFAIVPDDVFSPSSEIQECLWRLLLSQAAITFHAHPPQLHQYSFSSATSGSDDEENNLTGLALRFAKESVLICTGECSQLKQNELHTAADSS